jgi:Tol biopolymer transport system component
MKLATHVRDEPGRRELLRTRRATLARIRAEARRSLRVRAVLPAAATVLLLLLAGVACSGAAPSEISPQGSPSAAASSQSAVPATQPPPTASAFSLAGLTVVRQVDGVDQILVFDDSNSTAQLTRDAHPAGSLLITRWSPDGATIAYGRGMPPLDTYVASADGTGSERASNTGVLVAWSPDGRDLLIAEFEEVIRPAAGHRYWLVTVESGETEERVLPFGIKDWLPGGAMLSIVPTPTGTSEASLFDAETGELTFLLVADSVVFSSDGTRLAFVRARQCPGCSEVGVAAADGTNERVIAMGHAPQWSPDGSLVAYLEIVDDGPHAVLRVVTPEGEAVESLPELVSSHFVWTPDGRGLVVQTGDVTTNQYRLIHVELESGGVTDLGDGTLPSWRP